MAYSQLVTFYSLSKYKCPASVGPRCQLQLINLLNFPTSIFCAFSLAAPQAWEEPACAFINQLLSSFESLIKILLCQKLENGELTGAWKATPSTSSLLPYSSLAVVTALLFWLCYDKPFGRGAGWFTFLQHLAHSGSRPQFGLQGAVVTQMRKTA